MIKVLCDARMDTGGAGRYTRELPRQLNLLGALSVHAIERGSGLERLLHLPFSPWGRREVYLRVRRAQPDLLHGMHFEVPARIGVPSVLTVQDLIPLDFPAAMPNRIKRVAFEAILFRSIDRAVRVIAPSEITASSLVRRGVSSKVIRVIPLWVGEEFSPLTESERDSARTQFAEGRRYIAAIFHPREHKNFGALMRAAHLLKDKLDATFVAAGAVFQDEATRSVGILDPDDLRRFMGGADVFVVPSLLEGFGLPAAESLACGTPVISGKGLGALPWIESGVLQVDVEEPRDIAESIRILLEDDELRSGLALSGRRSAADLTLDRAARSTADIYMECV